MIFLSLSRSGKQRNFVVLLRAHLFEPGFSGRPGGTGLGLSISQLLAKQIGATLMLDATGPNGTSFRVTQALNPS